MKITVVLFFLFTVTIFSQSDTVYALNSFTIYQVGNSISVKDQGNKEVFTQGFNSINSSAMDLDGDGIEEFVVIDVKDSSYHLYIYNTIDTFSLSADINSGTEEPYFTTSEDVEGTIIVTGNADFTSYNEGIEDKFLPLNCWRYENADILTINDEIYSIFMNENEELVDYIDEYFNVNNGGCSSSKSTVNVIAAVYANYYNAGENSVASQFLKKYYLCGDFKAFKDKLDLLIQPEGKKQ